MYTILETNYCRKLAVQSYANCKQLIVHTCTSNVKYFFKFLMIITRNGSLIPRVFFASAGQVMYVVLTLVPTISRTNDWISLSVILFICPFLTFLSHICNGLLPMLYKIDKNPLWNVFLNMTPPFTLQTAHDTIHSTVCFQLWSKSASVQNLPRYIRNTKPTRQVQIVPHQTDKTPSNLYFKANTVNKTQTPASHQARIT